MSESEAPVGIPLRHAARFGWPLPPMAGGAGDAGDTPAPDQPADAGTGDTPDAGIAPDQQQPTIDWEKRYKDLQSYTSQRDNEYQQRLAALDDPEQFRALLAERGYMLEEPQVDDTLADPVAQLRQQFEQQQQQLADLMAQQQNQSAAAEEQQRYAEFREQYDSQLAQMGVPDALVEHAAEIAFNHLPGIQTPQGLVPDLEGAAKQIGELAVLFAQHPDARTNVLKDWRESKRAPHIGQVGTAGEKALPLDAGHAERVAAAVERIQMEQ